MTETPHTSRRTLLAASGSLATLGLAGCLGGDDDDSGAGDDADGTDNGTGNGNGNGEDAPADIAVAEFELLDRDHDEDVLVYVHDDHWHGDPLDAPRDDHLSLGAFVEDEDGEEIELGDGIALDVEIEVGEDAIDVESHGGHVHVHGEAEGFADVVFQLVEDDHVVYEAPTLEVDVGDHDHDHGHDHAVVEELKLFDRAGDEPEEVAEYHDGHWDGELPHVHVDDHVSLGATFFDDHGDEIPIGSSEEYELGVRVADDAEDGIVEIDEDERFHGDHVHIYGAAEGETDVVFMLWHDDHADWESDPIAIDVGDH